MSRSHRSAKCRDREAVLALPREGGFLGEPSHWTCIRVEKVFLPVDVTGHVLVVDRPVVDLDDGVDGVGSFPQTRGVAAIRVADLVEGIKRDVGALIQTEGKVDTEPRGEGIDIRNPGRDGVAVAVVVFSSQTAKIAAESIVRGTVHPRLVRGDKRQVRADGPAHDRGRPPRAVHRQGAIVLIADTGRKVILIAVVAGGSELEVLGPMRHVLRFREDDEIAHGRPGVDTVQVDGVVGPVAEIVDGDHAGRPGCRRRIGVRSSSHIVNGRDTPVDLSDSIGSVARYNDATMPGT